MNLSFCRSPFNQLFLLCAMQGAKHFTQYHQSPHHSPMEWIGLLFPYIPWTQRGAASCSRSHRNQDSNSAVLGSKFWFCVRHKRSFWFWVKVGQSGSKNFLTSPWARRWWYGANGRGRRDRIIHQLFHSGKISWLLSSAMLSLARGIHRGQPRPEVCHEE